MSRIVKSDFEQVKDFLRTYTIKDNLKELDFISFASSLHKKYYSYLVLMEEFRQFDDDDHFSVVLHANQFNYLQESVSDCGQCLFLAMNGCYKGAKLLLRSSIETFIRAISLDENPSIERETSVYEVFNKIKQVGVFASNQPLREIIHNEYKNLCGDVHTAGNTRMARVTALSYFPHFDNEESKKLLPTVLHLVPCYITLLCLKYNEQFHKIHYENKDVILQEILKDYRAVVYGIE